MLLRLGHWILTANDANGREFLLGFWWDSSGLGFFLGDALYDLVLEAARAGDVVGEATLNLAGNSLFMNYVLRIPYGDGTIDVAVDDRMYLINDHVLINESELKKFGVRVGSLSLVIIKQTDDSEEN